MGRVAAAFFMLGMGWGQPQNFKTAPAARAQARTPSAPKPALLEVNPADFSQPQYATFLNDEYNEGHVRVWRGVAPSQRWQLPPEAVQFLIFDPAGAEPPEKQLGRARAQLAQAFGKFNITDATQRRRITQWLGQPVSPGRRLEMEDVKGIDRPVGVPPRYYAEPEPMSDAERQRLHDAEMRWYQKQFEEAYRAAQEWEKSQAARQAAANAKRPAVGLGRSGNKAGNLPTVRARGAR